MGVDVRLQAVSKTYRSDASAAITALSDVTLQIGGGEVAAVVGPSGSGKSTLLHVIGAMDRPAEGTIHVANREVTSLSHTEQAEYRRTIGFVFQRFHLLAALTVIDNVVAPVLPYRTEFDRHERAKELLESVGLGDRGDSLPAHLSGGEQQRVAIARALINRPGLLLADEPTGNLDSETSIDIMELILELNRDLSMTVIVATHDPLIATRCRRIVRLHDGRVAEDLEVPHDKTPEETLERINRLGPGALS